VGTVGEDYRDNGDAWSCFTHDARRDGASTTTRRCPDAGTTPSIPAPTCLQPVLGPGGYTAGVLIGTDRHAPPAHAGVVGLSRVVAAVTLAVGLAAGPAGAGPVPSSRPSLCVHTRLARGPAAVWVAPCADRHP
jgi:hypothetical protein